MSITLLHKTKYHFKRSLYSQQAFVKCFLSTKTFRKQENSFYYFSVQKYILLFHENTFFPPVVFLEILSVKIVIMSEEYIKDVKCKFLTFYNLLQFEENSFVCPVRDEFSMKLLDS